MSTAFEKIKAGLEQATTHTQGKTSEVVLHEFKPMDVIAIRHKADMTQREFAVSFSTKLGTLRHWG